MRLTWVSGSEETQQVQYGDGETLISTAKTFSHDDMCSEFFILIIILKHRSMFLRTVWNVKIGMNTSFLRVAKRSLSVSGRESVRDLASKDGELRVFIVAGEVSGDIIASRFMNSLKKLSPFPVRFAGVGG